MLSAGARVLFAAVFVTALAALLTIWLQICGHLESAGASNTGEHFLVVLRENLAAAIYFLVLSGYVAAFLMSYFFFTKDKSALTRVAVSTLLFVASFVFFMLIAGDSFSVLEGTLLLAGAASVVISDAIANAVARIEKGRSAAMHDS